MNVADQVTPGVLPGQLSEDQSEVLRFLQDPSSYAVIRRDAVTTVERIDTHGAIVFLAGDRAYKIKRAVSYPYMDFSTLERRHWACTREMALNRRTAPGLYLEVLAITRDSNGALRFDGAGEAVEWVLVMERFPQENLLSNLAKTGALTQEVMINLAEEIAAFHGEAPLAKDDTSYGLGAAAIEWVVVENNEEFAARNDLFPAARCAELAERSLAALARNRALLDARAAAGHQRLCHGDLHLRNVVLMDGRPTLFDAIEFNDAIACVDVLYDLAFLLMDLEHRGLRPYANLVFNRYLHRRDEGDSLPLLPLFLSARAAVRAKVAASLEAVAEAEAEKCKRRQEALSYFAEALQFLAPAPARLVAVGGLSGTGKTCLARLLAPSLGAAPGAVHLRSDVLRKTLAGVEEHVRLPPEAYNRAAAEAVYQGLLKKARQALQAGQSVIVDAVFARPEERAAVASLAGELGIAFDGLWLQANPEILIARVEARLGDASDATPAVVQKQLGYDLGAIDWTRIDAAPGPEEVAAAAREALALRD